MIFRFDVTPEKIRVVRELLAAGWSPDKVRSDLFKLGYPSDKATDLVNAAIR